MAFLVSAVAKLKERQKDRVHLRRERKHLEIPVTNNLVRSSRRTRASGSGRKMLAGDNMLTTARLEGYMRKAEFRPPDCPEDG